MSELKQLIQHNNDQQQRFLVKNPRVFVDFHNADNQGRLRLNCIGTIEDLASQNIELKIGQNLILYSEDLEVDGIVEYSSSEHIWVTVIDWNKIRQVEENSVLQKLSEFVEKIGSFLAILETDSQATSETEQNTKQLKLDQLLDNAKRDLNDARVFYAREQENSENEFYQTFVNIFGEEEANEIWGARHWSENIVLRDLALILMEIPELRQNIEQKGFNLEKMINKLSQEEELSNISSERPETNQRSLARLREVICS